jgi:3-hydroxypropanoate dehydrogenase
VTKPLNDEALDMLFRKARSHNGWKDIPVSDEQLQQIYELMKWGPTAANSCPARIVFVKSPEAKEKLLACVNPGNVEKCRTAPVVAVIGMDLEFYEFLPKLFPHTDAKSWYVGKPDLIETNAFRNSTLQAAYFMMAVRSLGLDCGPMTGYNADKMNETFFGDGKVKVNMMCAIGYGDPEKLFPRHPRLDFDEACSII